MPHAHEPAQRGRRAEAARNDERILESARAVFVADPGAPIAAVADARRRRRRRAVPALSQQGGAPAPPVRRRPPALHRRRRGRTGRPRRPLGGVRGLHAPLRRLRHQLADPAAGGHLHPHRGALPRGRPRPGPAHGAVRAHEGRRRHPPGPRGQRRRPAARADRGDPHRRRRSAPRAASPLPRADARRACARPGTSCPARRPAGTRSPHDGTPEPAGAQPRAARAPDASAARGA